MSYQKGVMTCDGCRVPIDRREAHMTFVPRQSAGTISIPEDYHEVCWQTGWYTGIPPKGEFPEPEVAVRCTICTSKEHDTPDCLLPLSTESDPVNHPSHYTWLPKGIEVIDITEQLNFRMGNAVKYILRADHKGKPIQDLEKAVWYLEREIANREAAE